MFQFYNRFEDLTLHKNQQKAFLNALEQNRIHHAYILYGEVGSGKLAFSLMMSKHILCKKDSYRACNDCGSCHKVNHLNHPDLHLIFPVNKKNDDADPKSIEEGTKHYSENPFHTYHSTGNRNIFVESIRKIKSDSKYAAAESNFKIYIIHEAEFMNDASSNAFLKVMEEPPENTIIILTCSNIEKLLPTIRSRAQQLFFQRPKQDDMFNIVSKYNADIKADDLRLKIANGNLSKAFQYLSSNINDIRNDMLNFLRFTIINKPIQINDIISSYSKKYSKDEIEDFLTMLETWFRDISVLQEGSNQENLINIDLINELSKFSQRYQEMDFLEIISLLELTKEDIRRNVHVGLCLNMLSIKLRETIIRY